MGSKEDLHATCEQCFHLGLTRVCPSVGTIHVLRDHAVPAGARHGHQGCGGVPTLYESTQALTLALTLTQI